MGVKERRAREKSETRDKILDAAVAYERGSFAADSLQGHRRDAGDAYRQALRWAQSTVAEIA